MNELLIFLTGIIALIGGIILTILILEYFEKEIENLKTEDTKAIKQLKETKSK